MTGMDTVPSLKNTLENLSTEQLENWVRGRLRGHDPIARDYQSEPSYLLIARMYTHLSRNAREDLRLAVLRMVDEVGQSNDEWDEPAIISLLQVTDPILRGSAEHHEALGSLVGVTLRHRKQTVRFAAAQALVALGYMDTPRFWIDLHAREGKTFAPVIIEALARTSFQSLPVWMISVIPDDTVESAFFGLLPFLIELRGAEAVAHIIGQIDFKLSPNGRARVREFSDSEKLITPTYEYFRALPATFDAMAQILAAGDDLRTTRQPLAFGRALRRLRRFLRRETDLRSIPSLLALEVWSRYTETIAAMLLSPLLRNVGLAELRSALREVGAEDVIELFSPDASLPLDDAAKTSVVMELALDPRKREATRNLLSQAEELARDPDFESLQPAV